jgi:hypothetical protein
MKRFATALAIAVLAAAVAPATAEAGHVITGQPQQAPKAARKKPIKTQRSEPVKRQNFRARHPSEISPWEGFEDCRLGPCVGMSAGPRF